MVRESSGRAASYVSSPPMRNLDRALWRSALGRVVPVAAVVLLVAGCGGDDGGGEDGTETTATSGSPAPDTTPSPPSPPGPAVTVQALDNSFRPETVTVSVGTEVLFDNRGRNDHNVLPSDGGDEWGVQVEEFRPGDQYTVTFDEPGEYPYYCSIHGTADVGMIGTVVGTG